MAIKNQKDILRAKIDHIDNLSEDLKLSEEKIQELQKKRSEKFFMEFCRNEAKHDPKIAKILINKDSNPEPFQNLRMKYLRSVEKDEYYYDAIKESIEDQIEKWEENETEYHTVENLTNALKNLENPHAKPFRQRMIEKREDRRKNGK